MSNTGDNRETHKPLYKIVMDELLNEIEQGSFTFDKPFCTENSIIERFSVSRITARRAMMELENQGILMRKCGVGSFVKREYYDEWKVNRNLSDPDRLFAFVFPFTTSHTGLSSLLRAADDWLTARGYRPSVFLSGREDSSEIDILTRLLDMNADCVALWPYSSSVHQQLIYRFQFAGRPVIIMDIPSGSPCIPSITSDNFGGSLMLMEHLIGLGHRKIAYIGGVSPDKRATVSERLAGYIAAHADHGLIPDESLIHTELDDALVAAPLSDARSLRSTLQQLLKKGVTALLAENDETAYMILLCCKELGIDVPGELSICGFDDSDYARMLVGATPSLRLTTIAQDRAEMGRLAAELMLDSLGKMPHCCEPVRLPVKLVIGSTTAPPAQGN